MTTKKEYTITVKMIPLSAEERKERREKILEALLNDSRK